MPSNITVNVVLAFGLHWTARKRAAHYLQRYASLLSHEVTPR